MVREVGERAGEMFVLVEVVKLEGLKVAQKDVARQIGVLQAREVVERLRLRLPKIEAGALLLDEQYALPRSEEHTSELQSLMRISCAVFCWTKKNNEKLVSNHTPYIT